MQKIANKTFSSTTTLLATVLAICAMAFGLEASTTTTIFNGLSAAASDAAFGDLTIVGIALASVGGLAYALIKGAWLYAGLGIAVSGLIYGAQVVSTSAGFTALI